MEIMQVSKTEIAGWVSWLHQAGSSMPLGILLAGDRWSCADIIFAAKIEDEIAGIATIASEGEGMSGEPTMVALYIPHRFRGQGVGFALFRETADYGVRQFGTLRLDVLNSKVMRFLGKLPEEAMQKLKVIDQSSGEAIDSVMES